MAIQQCIRNNEDFDTNINPPVLGIIGPVLYQHNPFAAAYRNMYEVELEQNCLGKEHGKQPPNVRMYLLEGSRDPTSYNQSQQKEVAAVYVMTKIDGTWLSTYVMHFCSTWDTPDLILTPCCTYRSIVKPTEMTPWMTTAMPLHPSNTKIQPPARSAEFVFRIRRQIGYYVSPFHAVPKENQHYQKL